MAVSSASSADAVPFSWLFSGFSLPSLVSLHCSSSSRKPYHVFLSFRGEDIRNTFLAHLYTALSGAGFRTFKDDDGIRRGENIGSELEKAIVKEARSSIIVFSKNYASSKWCLDELVMILQHNRTSGHKILPVFYHVDPSHVRNQTGSFEEAFRGHEERIKMEMDERRKEQLRNKLEGWRAALKQVCGLAGRVLADRRSDESKFIQDIVKEIAKNVNRRVLYVDPHIVGMESRVENIISWLEDDSDNAAILVIYGIGGIGKTTIAKYVYNLYFERFEGSSFLADVRERSEDRNGLIKLQKQLLSEILGREKEKISSVDEGINRIGDAIGCKKALVVLDDVDDKVQFEAVIGMRDYFHPGSKIILTTRRKDLLKANEVYRMHEVERFDDYEALKLFSWHAFGQGHPIEGYIDHSEGVIEHCGGIPLALKVIGSSLSGKSSEVWESKLQKLATIPDSQILEKLKTSYDSLQDDHDRNLFLHIVCFFIGMDKYFTVTVLDKCDFCTIIGIENLIDRCLLNINEHNKLTMHQLLRDMGREIISKESSNPGQRSRLWNQKDSFNVLREKTGTETIQGLFLDMHLLEEDKWSNRSFCIRNTKRHRFEELGDKSLLADQCNSWKRRCFGLSSWNPIKMAIRNSDQEKLKTDAFAGMHNLTLLQLHYVEIEGRYKDFPKRLRWLGWHGFPLESMPNDFSLEFLVALDLRYSKLKQVWKGTKILGMLKILNLSHSHALANSPDFLQVPNLEKLVLQDCTNLVGLDESIGKLGSLVLLNLRGCKNLRKLPREIFQLKSLKELNLSGCSRLHRLPTDFGEMESSRVLHVDGINQSHSTGGEIKPWLKLVRKFWKSKPTSPESFRFSLTSLPCCLVRLSLAKCNLSSDCISENLFTMSKLEELNLSGNPMHSLPALPSGLRRLHISRCSSLEMLTNLPNLSKLIFEATYSTKLAEVQGLFKLAPVKNIDSEMVKELGLADLDSDGRLLVKLANQLTLYNQCESPVLQALHECGIYSIFLRSCSAIPDWFDKQSRGGSRLSFTVPSSPPNLKIRSLNVCVVFESYNKPYNATHTDYVVVNNETRNLTVIYTPIFKSYDVGDEDLMWLSDWKIANQLMGPGDKVNVWIANQIPQKVKEFRIRIVYDDNPATCHQDVHLQLSDYEIKKGVYFLRTERLGWPNMYSPGADEWPGMMGSQVSSEQSTGAEGVDDADVAYNGDDCAFLKHIGSALKSDARRRRELDSLVDP